MMIFSSSVNWVRSSRVLKSIVDPLLTIRAPSLVANNAVGPWVNRRLRDLSVLDMWFFLLQGFLVFCIAGSRLWHPGHAKIEVIWSMFRTISHPWQVALGTGGGW